MIVNCVDYASMLRSECLIGNLFETETFKVSFLNISSEMHYIAKVTDLQRKIVKEKKTNKSKYFQDIYERNKNNQYHRLTYLIYYARMFSELSYILTVNLFFFKKQLRKSDNFSFYFIYGLIIYNKYNMYSTCVDSGKHVFLCMDKFVITWDI